MLTSNWGACTRFCQSPVLRASQAPFAPSLMAPSAPPGHCARVRRPRRAALPPRAASGLPSLQCPNGGYPGSRAAARFGAPCRSCRGAFPLRARSRALCSRLPTATGPDRRPASREALPWLSCLSCCCTTTASGSCRYLGLSVGQRCVRTSQWQQWRAAPTPALVGPRGAYLK